MYIELGSESTRLLNAKKCDEITTDQGSEIMVLVIRYKWKTDGITRLSAKAKNDIKK